MDTQPAKQSAKPHLASADKSPSRRGDFDGRTRRSRRRRELIAAYSNTLGGDAALTAAQKVDVRKAAELVALSESARALAMREGCGGPGALSALLRLESASARAVRALRLPAPNAAPAQTLQDYLASLEQAAAERTKAEG